MKKTMVATLLILLVGGGPVHGDDPPLTSLNTATARSDIRSSRGVVFVDLYADW